MTEHLQTGAPAMGAPSMGTGASAPHQPAKAIAISDAISYLPIVYRAIEHIGDITAFVGKVKPYAVMLANDLPDLIAEGKAILNQIAPNLLAGMAAEPVKFNIAWVQAALNKANNAGLKVDGKYGDLTHAAIGAYQTARGLEPDTWAGPLTVAKLFKEVGANP